MSAQGGPSNQSPISPTSSNPPSSALFQHSPAPDAKVHREWEPGCQPEIVYETALNPWRAAARRWLVARLKKESQWLADWQGYVRTEDRDRYFYWTAIFGTHTFFMAFLPLLFFLGYPETGRGLLYVVGLGIYTSCVAKDLVCTPRPYSPPVIRLSMSTHHHEYGFPSSHSTNAVSIALFGGQVLWNLRESIGVLGVGLSWLILLVYFVSIAGGRLYTGMHSTADIIGGSLLGIACWLAWLVACEASEAWVNSGSVLVPIITGPLTLALVHYHPETMDDCPCFEDAIAILSVVLGSFLGHWGGAKGYVSLPVLDIWANGIIRGFAVAVGRVVIGIAVIFSWRVMAKTTLLRVLPSLFRTASVGLNFRLPTRRFYRAATDYTGVADAPIRAFPSFVDLNASSHASSSTVSSPVLEAHESIIRSPSPFALTDSNGNATLRLRASRANGAEIQNERQGRNAAAKGEKVMKATARKAGARPRYDAEVLTKVVVYTGIGLLATTVVPAQFERIEAWLGLT